MARMQILSSNEYMIFEAPPLFDHRDRKKFFEFSKPLLEIAQTIRNPVYQVYFLVSCGYFRVSRRFFPPKDFHQRDIKYVASRLDMILDGSQTEIYTDRTRQRHQKLILDFYGFRSFDADTENTLNIEISAMVRTHLKPKLIFHRCVDFLIQNRMQVPKAGTLVELVRSGLHARKAELMVLMDKHLSDKTRQLLDMLFTTPDNQNQYRLTLLKKLSHSTKPSRVRECVTDFGTLSELYNQLEGILAVLDLGHAGIRYYAGSVLKAEIFQIQRRETADRYIHATAFVAHQFYRIQDNLIDILLSVVASFQTAALREHKERSYEKRKEQNKRLKSLISDLDKSVFGLIHEIRQQTETEALSDTDKIRNIKMLLDQSRDGDFETLKSDLESSGDDQAYYEVLEERSLRLQNRLSPILKVLTFQPNSRAFRLMQAIDHFKTKDGVINDQAPMDFLEDNERKAVIRDDDTFRPSLYKVFLFLHVSGAIKSGNLNVQHSYKYRPMDTYLISPERWRQEKSHLMERAGLTEFLDPNSVLQALDEVLHTQYQTTNFRANKNTHLKLRTDGKFHIATPALDLAETDPLQGCFPERQDVPLAQVLETVNSHCGMLAAFQHWQQTHSRQAIPRPALLAGIIGLGCSIGVLKMARISSRITESELEHAVNWRFSLENIREANNLVLKAMDKMELPNLYRRERDKLHTASDGQKFEVRTDSLHASRSFKYFGQSQGVSAYAFVDERNFLWHSLMISAADRESAYVIDGLMRNDVVKSDIHSTDTHGFTEAIFGLTHLLGFSFAPRIKGLNRQTLYLFRSRKKTDRSDWVITPNKYINDALIRENWDDLLRLITTIKLKENTASDIFRRLNSYSRQHALYQTIKAFGQIIKSLFILRYIDDLELRQAIEKQLNKVELSNRFTRAVAVGNPREYTQAEKEEQEIAESCNRLIKNSVICWNYLYLTRKLEKFTDQEARENLLRTITSHSVMTWAHVNMLGEYDFSDEKLKDSAGILPLKSAA
ncbi:MAG: Tn3 family transposase [Magnetococcales bacterium]|nr:Tn3 family transposase [Magnetococcales bacterium]